jgi:hypothetical protein
LALRITEEHYQFDKSPVKKKVFRNHLSIWLLNTIIPILFAFAKAKEKNFWWFSWIAKWNFPEERYYRSLTLWNKVNKRFWKSSIVAAQNEYCNKSRCLECAIGMELRMINRNSLVYNSVLCICKDTIK